MFRLPKTSNQSPVKKSPNVLVNSVNASKNQGLCKFSHRKCNFVCLDNYDYCLKHILEDKSSPYKPCTFLYTVSGKKCGKPALRQDRKDTWLCAVHYRKTHIQRQRALSRHAPPKTQEALFATLGHYVPPEQPAIKREEPEYGEPIDKEKFKAVDPFVDIDAGQANSRVSQVLDYISDSDSDVETAMLDSVWRAQDHESSDAESVDSQNEDPLKHAGTYTAEEVTIIIKDKMLRLQSLYIDQFRRLHHLLKEKRRKYLHAIKKEKETLCSIHDQEKQTAREQKLYQKLKALNRYHKHHGVEAVLHKKALELRAQVTEGHQMRTSHKGKCAFTEGGVKCGAKTLPVTKYCRKHILEDTQQVLFRACGVKRDDHTCLEPTLNVFENATCVYHSVMLPLPRDRLVKPETQTSEGENSQTTQNESENSFANLVDSEELLIKEILKPGTISATGKPDSVDALELSRTVSDILALAEAHVSTEIGQPPEKSFIEQDIVTTGNEPSKPFIAENMETSSSETVQTVVNQNDDTLRSESSQTNSEKDSEILPGKTDDNPSGKMDIDEEPLKPVSPSKEPVKQESSEDLVMVDMMSDVGVVEEVLETEQFVEDSEVVVSSEHDERKNQQTGESEPKQVVSKVISVDIAEQLKNSDRNTENTTDQAETDQKTVECEKVEGESENIVEKTDQQIVSEPEEVSTEQKTKQEIVCDKQKSTGSETAKTTQETGSEESMEVDVETVSQPDNN